MSEQSIVLSHTGPTLELAISVWLDAKTRKSGSQRTHDEYTRTIEGFRAMLRRADLDLDSDARAIALAAQAWAFRSADGVRPVKGSTANLRLSIISSFYCFGAKYRLLVDAEDRPLPNPIDVVERATIQPYAGARPLSAESVTERLGEIDRSTLLGMRDYALLALAFQTGRRANELRMLTVGDLELERDRLTVTWRRCKGGKVMYDIIGGSVLRTLVEWLERFYGEAWPTEAPVFPSLSNENYGVMMEYGGIRDAWLRRLDTGKVHTSRHTLAHEMEDAGAKVSEIAAQLGHTDISVTSKYLQSLSNGENRWAPELARRMGLGQQGRA